jgi:hypothetical protein
MKIRFFRWLVSQVVADFGCVAGQPNLEYPFLESELIFPKEHRHDPASCIVEYPNGGRLVCWFHGAGERAADDVAVSGAQRP